MVHSLAQKTCGRPEGKPSPKAITYTLMKLLRVKLLLRRKVLDITTICLENGCRNMQKNVVFNLYLTNSKVQKKKKKSNFIGYYSVEEKVLEFESETLNSGSFS